MERDFVPALDIVPALAVTLEVKFGSNRLMSKRVIWRGLLAFLLVGLATVAILN
jgi:hypothetical protein